MSLPKLDGKERLYAVVVRMDLETYYIVAADNLTLNQALEASKDAARQFHQVKRIPMDELPIWKAHAMVATNTGSC